MSADVYSNPQQIGRGGWTWYTGSAGWMYRAGLEWLLGMRLHGASLFIDPCIPKTWPGFEVSLQFRRSHYEIAVQNPRGVSRGASRLTLDDELLADSKGAVPLVDDGRTHRITVVLG
jgi:cyclic beta-1,2-glucan synthetase